MSNRVIILSFSAGLLLLFATAASSMPALYNIVLDATGSISRTNFNTAKEQVVAFARFLHSNQQDGQHQDMLSVNFFGGSGEYDGTMFVNCSDTLRMAALTAMLLTKDHPKFNSTAIYSAIAIAAVEIAAKDSQLPGTYIKNIIVVTDGTDNDSPARIRREVRDAFPNARLNLFVVGVRTQGATREFKGVADEVFPIDQFDELLAALIAIARSIRQ